MARNLPVYRSGDFRVVSGANEGDGLSFASDLVLDDVYALNSDARRLHLALTRSNGRYCVAQDSEAGVAGSEILLDCAVTLMHAGTLVTEMLVLVEVDPGGHVLDVYLLPFATLAPRRDYSLLRIDTDSAPEMLAQVACVSFTRGTLITLGSGRQCPVEELKTGEDVLTRDHGVQPLRWVGQTTQRAIGAFAPIRIAAGTLNNTNDLVVSPDHRLLFYQRSDRLNAGRAELMIRARQLVNGKTVTIDEGGFVDYFQLLFDSHQIIYAEGIAAESMVVDDTTAPLLTPEMLADLSPAPAVLRELSALEVRNALVDRPDAVDLLRRASRG
jgi:hypothetical protein